jgi:hypothetical protein
MSGAARALPRSALKGSNATRRLHRGIGTRELINANGRAIVPERRLMFANVAQLRPFNFRNTTVEAGTANFNHSVALVNGKNARGRPPRIGIENERRASKYAAGIGPGTAVLEASEGAARAARRNALKLFREGRATPETMLGLPVINALRNTTFNRVRPRAKEARLMAAQYDMGHPVPELNSLALQGANDEYIAEQALGLMQNYQTLAAHNEQTARNAATVNTDYARRIQEEAAGGRSWLNRSHRSRKSRRNNRKSRKSRR